MQKQEIMMICIYITTKEKKKYIIYQKSSNVFQSLQKKLSCKYQRKMENPDPYYIYTKKNERKKNPIKKIPILHL